MADELKNSLKKVLASNGDKKFFFAYGTGKRKDGKGDGELTVAGKKPKAADVEKGLEDCKEVYEGTCWVGKGPENAETVYFQGKGKKLSSLIITKMKLTAKVAAGRQYDFQMPSAEEEARAGSLVEGEDAGAGPSEATPSSPAATAQQPQQNPAALKFAAKLKGLMPVMQKADATNSEPAKAAHAQIAAANKLYQEGQYDQANSALDRAEALLKQALNGGAPTAAAPAAPAASSSDAARFVARLKALAPVLQKAEATGSDAAKEAKLHIGEANKRYVAKEYDKANAALDRAEAAIKKAFAGAAKSGAAAAAPAATGALAEVEKRWRAARADVAADLEDFRKSLLANPEIKEDPRFNFVRAASAEIPNMLPRTAALSAGLASGDAAQARAAIAKYRSDLASASSFTKLETYAAKTLGRKLAVRDTLTAAMSEMETKLAKM